MLNGAMLESLFIAYVHPVFSTNARRSKSAFGRVSALRLTMLFTAVIVAAALQSSLGEGTTGFRNPTELSPQHQLCCPKTSG